VMLGCGHVGVAVFSAEVVLGDASGTLGTGIFLRDGPELPSGLACSIALFGCRAGSRGQCN